MVRESKNKSFMNWIEEIREEIEIQFFGITGAICFFVVFYFIFKPVWMKNVVDFFFEKYIFGRFN